MEDSAVPTPNSSLYANASMGCQGDSCSCLIELNYRALDNATFIFYLFFLIVGLIENIIVIWINWRMKESKKESNLYIFNMAIADMGAILFIPLRMTETIYNYRWIWGSFMCKFDSFFYFVNLYSSIFFLACFSVDKYFSLGYPSQAQGSRERQIRRMVCVCVWTVAVILSIPDFIYNRLFGTVYRFCFFDSIVSAYVLDSFSLLFGFVIPLPVIVVSNVFTARAVKDSSDTQSRGTCKIIYAYIIVFLLCWSPFYIILFLYLIDQWLSCFMTSLVYFFYDLAECLTFSHCIINPILFNFMHKDFRHHLATNVVKYTSKQHVEESDDVSISSDTRQIVVII
uniref:G-protein coupled receptor 182-like n=1 Tax=Pristiophorus japonicus TaxID=55135 RepID=UPI00398F3EEC